LTAVLADTLVRMRAMYDRKEQSLTQLRSQWGQVRCLMRRFSAGSV
jgi:hypothetical protein